MKRISVVLSVILMLCLLFTACGETASAGGDISGYADNVNIVGLEVPEFSVDEKGDFTVLQFSDTHIISGSTKKDVKTLSAVRKQIENEKPKLVVISGDMVEGNTNNKKYDKKSSLEIIAAMFEELNQPWAYVPGNNDGEQKGSSADVAAFLSQYSQCIVSNEEGLTGAVHYSIDLRDNNGKIVHSLIFMDSLSRNSDNEYDCMKDDQVKWFADTVNEKKQLNDNLRVSLFFHMNTPDFVNASQKGEAYNNNYAVISEKLRNSIPDNDKIDNTVKASEIVGLVSIGHIHPDENWCSYYDGRYYHITRAAGYNATKNTGCTLITIHTAADNTKEMYDFKEIKF